MIWRQQQINSCCKLSVVALLVFLAFGSCLFNMDYVFAQIDQTSTKLQAANTAVNQAFNAVLDAEKAGANVTGLLAQLNVAEDFLAQAENSNRTGYFSGATAQTGIVLSMAQQVTAAAQYAKQTAIASHQNAIWYTIVFTVIGVFDFILALLMVWLWFKRRYIKNLSQSKPEVNS